MSASPHVTDCPLDRVRPPDPSTRTKGPLITIDLGTTSCRVAAMQQGNAVCIPSERQSGAPSYVALGSGGRLLVGQAAQQQMSSAPSLAVWGIKGLLTSRYGDPKMRWLHEQLRCELIAGGDGRPAAQLGDRLFTAQELAALLLFEARERAQNFVRQPIYRAVLTLPATRDTSLQGVMRQAAALAGLHLERIISEPTAIALGSFQRRRGKPERTSLVCDWGGGSFHASLVRYSARECQVLASESDVTLCGAELDKRLLRWLLGMLPAGAKLAADAKNPAVLFRLAAAAERAKAQLSEQHQARVHVPFATTTANGTPGDFDTVVTRNDLEELATPLIDSVLALCERVLEQKGLFPGDLDEVLLAGDQCRMPLFQERARRFFIEVPLHIEDPGQAVVLGAMRLGAQAEGSPPSREARSPMPQQR